MSQLNNSFVNKLRESGKKMVLIGTYTNNKTPTEFQCTVCNRPFTARPMKVLTTKRCPHCFTTGVKHTEEKFLERLRSERPDCVYISGYTDMSTPCEFKHLECGSNFSMPPTRVLAKSGCPECNHPHSSKTTEEFANELKEVYGDEYTVIGEYVNNQTPIPVIHTRCGSETTIVPVRALQKRVGCKHCAGSNASRFVADYLTRMGIPFLSETVFEDCYFQNLLKFDFLIPSENLIIEYDGEMHFRAFYNDIEKLIVTHKRDTTKNLYVQEKTNYRFLRIHYKCPIEVIQQILDNLSTLDDIASKYDLFYISDSEVINSELYYSKRIKDYETFKAAFNDYPERE